MRLARYRCANCDLSIHGTHDDPICHSGLYQSDNIVLCKRCSKSENRQIDEKGTNNIPELLRQYRMKKTYDTPDE